MRNCDMSRFSNENINFDVLKERAYNFRWAEVPEGMLPLTAADADFPAAREISEALIDYINGGYFCYTPKLGFPDLKESIAKSLWIRKKEKVDPEQILPIDSAARGMYIIAQTVLQPGDEAIIFDPVDFLFKESTLAAGATPVLFPAVIKDGRIDLSTLESYITPKTKMIGLCNPHNPLGKLYPKEDLQFILDLAEKYDLYIMNDEIWSDIVYKEKEFLSILCVDETKKHRVLSVFGFSKSFAIAGLRAGCIYCDNKEMFDRIVQTSAVLTTAGGISSLSQVAAKACVEKCYYWVDEFIEHLTKNRDYAMDRLSKMEGITCEKPEATFLLFPDISATGLTSDEFVEFMKEKANVAFVPGSDAFFGPGSAGHIRICFSTSFEVLKEGLDRLEKGLKLLNRK
jgi:aspartate/methionine/tyrosine aminotransferase